MPDEQVVPIRVVVVDDHSVVRSGLKAYLQGLPDMEVIDEAPDGEAAIALVQRLSVLSELPDVVLMDLVMPKVDGVLATKAIKQAHPGVHVVVMTSFGEAERVHNALEAGASGYLLKDADADEVAVAIRSALNGELHLDSVVAKRLAQSLIAPTSTAASLTAREREVLILVAKGDSNREIARKLVISERTARTHVSNILLKLGLASRTQAALWAMREGLWLGPTP